MFRPAVPDDAPAIAALANAAYRMPPGPNGWTSEAELIAGQRTDAAMLTAQLATPGVTIVVATIPAGTPPDGTAWRTDARSATAVHDGTAIACVQLAPTHDPAVAEIGLFAVHPDHQGTGVGAAILTRAEDLAHSAGYQRVRLYVIDIRSELLAWYHRRGYTPTGEVQAFPYEDERFGVPRRDDLQFAVLERELPPHEPGGRTPGTRRTGPDRR